jgi:hypothetical protein
VIVQLRHDAVQSIAGMSLPLPTAEEEAAEPTRADEVYGAAVTIVIGATRNPKRFPLLFKENVSYGFRRNLLGLRPAGIACSIATMVIVALVYIVTLISGSGPTSLAAWSIPMGVALLALIAWLRLTGEWVRPIADAYAQRLFEAARTLMGEGEVGTGTRSTQW